MSTLKGIFSSPKPIRRNFIQENVRQLRDLQKCRQIQTDRESVQQSVGKLSFMRTPLNVPSHLVNSAKVVSKLRPDPQDMKPRTVKSNQVGPVHNGVATNKAAYGKPAVMHDLKVKQSRKVKAAARAKKEIDAEQMKENDVAKYVRQQRASILHKQSIGDSQLLSDSDLSLDLSAESVELPGSPVALTHRTTGSQTIDPKNLDNLYTEGVIRYPSTHRNGVPINNSKSKLVDNSTQQPSQKESRQVDFVHANVATAAAVHNRFALPNADPNKAPPKYQKGVVPKYLQKRQVEWQKESEEVLKSIPDPTCPAGHVPLPESERRETLKMIRKSHADYVHELNMMPVRTDTLRMRQRKMELEKQLNKLEEGIKVFSRPKVFVKIGE